MTDANLVRHLQAQTRRKVGLIAHPVVRSGAGAIKQECSRLRDEGLAVEVVEVIAPGVPSLKSIGGRPLALAATMD